ncbi:MAG: hypothetical protein LUD50_01550 [Clostridia bacterium]|nr:hypothetical protein [Clostridia bacterium]
MADKKFIQRIAVDFAEMGYRPTEAVSLEDLRACAFNTMFHCQDPETAGAVRESLTYCTKKWKKIQRAFAKDKESFIELMPARRYKVKQVPDKSTIGTYLVTNSIDVSENSYYYIFHAGDPDISATDGPTEAPSVPCSEDTVTAICRPFARQDEVFMAYKKGQYWSIKTIDYNRIILYGEHRKPVCSIVSNPETKDILLMDCFLPYAVLDYTGSLSVYDRTYIYSLPKGQFPDKRKTMATIRFAAVDDNRYGITMITTYKPMDVEFLLMLAYGYIYLMRQNTTHDLASKSNKLFGIV